MRPDKLFRQRLEDLLLTCDIEAATGRTVADVSNQVITFLSTMSEGNGRRVTPTERTPYLYQEGIMIPTTRPVTPQERAQAEARRYRWAEAMSRSNSIPSSGTSTVTTMSSDSYPWEMVYEPRRST